MGSRRMENEEKEEPRRIKQSSPPQVRNGRHAVKNQAEFPSPGEKQEACDEIFSKNSSFFTRGEEEVRFFILQEWALCHSRRGCHVIILRPPRMRGKRCDNP
jgi:hypothetical protein